MLWDVSKLILLKNIKSEYKREKKSKIKNYRKIACFFMMNNIAEYH